MSRIFAFVLVLLAFSASVVAAPLSYVAQLDNGVTESGLFSQYANIEDAIFYRFSIDAFTPNVWLKINLTQPDNDQSLFRTNYQLYNGIFSDTNQLSTPSTSTLNLYGSYTGAYAWLDKGDYTVVLNGIWEGWRNRPDNIGYEITMWNISPVMRSLPEPSDLMLVAIGLAMLVGVNRRLKSTSSEKNLRDRTQSNPPLH